MDGPGALPRENGEVVFAAPWEARAFALAVALVEKTELPWDTFRTCLIDAIRSDPDRPYFESWARALEALLIQRGLASVDELDAATPTGRQPL